MLAKRLFDLASAGIVLLLLVPFFMVIAVLIKLDSTGPIFFRQVRVGRNGRLFRIYKFRTMQMDSESKRQITVGHDSRITRLGHGLRHYKLDELPQLLNVILGDMSVVGPRPEVPKYCDKYPDALRTLVLSVRPGITDRASIAFKDENMLLAASDDPEKAYVEEILPVKLKYNEQYVQTRSMRGDLRIIFDTLRAIAD
jgi:lipopolysaccharide/colanic/teichoic acid biosynthesis glycosyltransferase